VAFPERRNNGCQNARTAPIQRDKLALGHAAPWIIEDKKGKIGRHQVRDKMQTLELIHAMRMGIDHSRKRGSATLRPQAALESEVGVGRHRMGLTAEYDTPLIRDRLHSVVEVVFAARRRGGRLDNPVNKSVHRALCHPENDEIGTFYALNFDRYGTVYFRFTCLTSMSDQSQNIKKMN
jgi:hypothetical protein